MEFKRVTSALLGLPMVIVVLLLGNKYIIDIAFAIVAVISLHEYFNAFNKYKPIRWIGYTIAVILCFINLLPVENISNYILLAIPFIVVAIFIELIIRELAINIVDIAITLFGIMYICLFTAFLPLLASRDNGRILIWVPFLIAWGTDIFAYLVGKTFKLGKHKFTKISPNKSIEGCIGGIIGAIIFMIVYTLIISKIYVFEVNYMLLVIYTILLSIIGQFGDLAASSIKRYVDIKDFSNLIPGHGGLLDRIDSLIFIAPFAYILLVIL